MSAVQPIPAGYPRVTPYLSVDGGAAAIDFYVQVLGATESVRMAGPEGKIGHAELKIGDSLIMLADASAEMGGQTPGSLSGTPVTLMVYVEDVDTVCEKAVAAGATMERDVDVQFYGDRAGQFVDPFGHKWFIATHVEDVDPEEMQRRAAKVMAG
jgi:PhnB protein